MQNNSSVIKSKKGIQIIKREGEKNKKTKQNIGSADRLFNVQMFAPVTLFSFHNPTVH